MGSKKSKVKRVSCVSPDLETKQVPGEGQVPVGVAPRTPATSGARRLLAAVPVSDLGESLDSRHWDGSLNASSTSASSTSAAAAAAPFRPDMDSVGYSGCNLEEEFFEDAAAGIITEHSDPEVVGRVLSEFLAPQHPELLFVQGKACQRILSGYQKSREDEARILAALREEGLLARPKSKTVGGLSFEVVEAHHALREEGPQGEEGGPGVPAGGHLRGAFVAALPRKTLERLELRRRVTLLRPSMQLEEKLAVAEARRRAAEEDKVRGVKGLRNGTLSDPGDPGGRRMTLLQSASERRKAFSASVSKRQHDLEQIRDRLRERKNDHLPDATKDRIRTKMRLAAAAAAAATVGDRGDRGDPPTASDLKEHWAPIKPVQEPTFFDD